MLPLTVPQQGTAVRPTWADLPASVRGVIERRCGSPVVDAESIGAGFTPGFASRLRLADGRRIFVKAADDATRPVFANSYREEIRKIESLPDAVPAARLLWSLDADGWVVIGLEDIEGRHPERPWRSDQLALVLAALDATARALTPPPAGPVWSRLADDVDAGQPRWEQAAVDGYAPAWLRPHLAECAYLTTVGAEALDGETLVHTDVRDDNILIDANDRVWICDWNWPTVGNAALDTMVVLASAHGDGHDADHWLTRCETTRAVEPAEIDGILAVLAGYFWQACQLPSPATSPWLRIHQRWYAEATIDWLARRRGWR